MDIQYTRALFLNARRYPRKPAVVFEGKAWTYAQFYERVARIGTALSTLGVGPGDRVSILSRNHPDMLAMFFAVLGLGASPAPINYRLKDDDIVYVAQNSAPKAVVLGAGYDHFVDALNACLPQAQFLAIGNVTSLPSLDDLISSSQPLEFDWTKATNRALLYTSGTTGRPKGTLRSRWGMSARAIEQGFVQEDRTLGVLPLCLSFGYTYALLPLYLGATLYLERDFDVARVIRVLAESAITTMVLIPTLIQRLVDDEGFARLRCPSLRLIQSGAGALTYEIRTAVTEKFGPVLSTYAASTEAGPYANCKGRDVLLHPEANCVGRPFFGSEVRLLDDDGNEVPTGEVGEICVRGFFQYEEYLNEPELTAATRRGDMVTVGDLGRFDEDGFLYLVGRKRDIIKTGGINVPAGDVENVIARHPAVAEVACLGLPDRTWGELVCAAVVIKPGMTVGKCELVDYCSEHLSRFQVPRRVLFLPELPRNLSGKIMKDELREVMLAFEKGSK